MFCLCEGFAVFAVLEELLDGFDFDFVGLWLDAHVYHLAIDVGTRLICAVRQFERLERVHQAFAFVGIGTTFQFAVKAAGGDGDYAFVYLNLDRKSTRLNSSH